MENKRKKKWKRRREGRKKWAVEEFWKSAQWERRGQKEKLRYKGELGRSGGKGSHSICSLDEKGVLLMPRCDARSLSLFRMVRRASDLGGQLPSAKSSCFCPVLCFCEILYTEECTVVLLNSLNCPSSHIADSTSLFRAGRQIQRNYMQSHGGQLARARPFSGRHG